MQKVTCAADIIKKQGDELAEFFFHLSVCGCYALAALLICFCYF